ncbi:MAG: hypothetical protein AAFY37_12840 [Pseudomonadota bacterium]
MNPYNRFSTVSTVASATIIIGLLAGFGMQAFDIISQNIGSDGPAVMGAVGAAVTSLVVAWLALTEVLFPALFRLTAVRKAILGKYYIEGTWLQAERGAKDRRMAVIDIQPAGRRFIFSGYTLNEDLEIEANTLIEFSRFEWPYMTYKYRNSLSDGSDGQRDGVGEIQLEMNREAARRYNGFFQYVQSAERMKIEGAKLVNNREVKDLRTLEGRQNVFEKYWRLFFQTTLKAAAGSYPVRDATKRPNLIDDIAEDDTAETDRAEPTVVPRRRATDWNRNAEPRPVDGAKLRKGYEEIEATGTKG